METGRFWAQLPMQDSGGSLVAGEAVLYRAESSMYAH